MGCVEQSVALPGFWCERMTYRSLAADDIVSVSCFATTNPAQAVRKIRVAVRALVSALPTREMARAFEWTDGAGCIGAVAALHRGEPCGFSLSSHDGWVEWTIRPVKFLPLANLDPFSEYPRAVWQVELSAAPLAPASPIR